MFVVVDYFILIRIRKISKSDGWIRLDRPYVRPSVWTEHLGFLWTAFHEIRYAI